MTEARRQLDGFIRRLKHDARLRHVRFVREYAAENAEHPLTGMLAVVGVTKLTRERGFLGGWLGPAHKGERYSAEAEISVYAPSGVHGASLSETVGALLEGLDAADREQVITDAAAFPIEFDADRNVIFRRVRFRMAFSQCAKE